MSDVLGPALGALFDALRGIGGVRAGLGVLALGLFSFLLARLLQRNLVRALEADPNGRVRWSRLELLASAPGLLVWLADLVRLWIVRPVIRLRERLKGRGAPAPPAAPIPQPLPPLLVASLGPSYLLGGLAAALLCAAARLLEPLLRARLGAPAAVPAWELLLFGGFPELGPYLPLGEHPFLAGLLAVVFWTLVWSAASRLIRLVFASALGRNLAEESGDGTVLPLWRRQAGALALWRPAPSYSTWASWVVALAFPFLVWAWFSLNGRPWRVAPSDFAVAFVLWLSWAFHLLLRGLERVPAAAAEETAAGGTEANGWPEVVDFLRRERQVAEPLPFRAPRPIEPLQLTTIPPEIEGVLSPLVLELLPAPGRLTAMQRAVLTDLSLQAFVHVAPPVSRGSLALAGAAEEVLQDRSGLRHRNQIVLAPEAAGKTTLAVLAAANHALVHTRGTLIVARDEEHEAFLGERCRALVEPSTMRWNVRVRRVGADLMSDLSRGIVPDVLVCSLHPLTVQVLGHLESFAPFLENLGLIVVDDVELFHGPVEAHAQLAFRRLTARLGELLGVAELGERSAPLVLVLGGDSMRDPGAWARSLCGIDAVVRDFTRSGDEMEEREAAEMAARGLALRPEAEGPAASPLPEGNGGRQQLFYRLRDFRSAAGEALRAADLVAACEHLAVPWCYRPCGDARRRLGRRPLLLRDEPRHTVDAPEDACVVLLEGRWSEVRRERLRLRRAGARAAGPVAFVTLIDPDEDMAFTQLDSRFGLAEVLRSLPQPVLRPPSGRVVQSHLASDLVQHWMEVAEVLRLFGHATAHTLRRLSRGGLLLTERRTDVHPEAAEYVRRVYVRALARAVAPLLSGHEEDEPPLPLPVSQVELLTPRVVALRDRTRPAVALGRVDASAAGFLYYPGRIFTDARGSFVVVGRAGEEIREEGVPVEDDDILLEPLLTDDVSSPRRRLEIAADGLSREVLARVEGPVTRPEPVLFGRYPVGLGLIPVRVAARHVATYRLGPELCEVRQRLLRRDERAERAPLATRAAVLLPNLAPAADGVPLLRFGEARLIAAAMRVVLPSMVRGAAESLEVAIRLEGAADPQRPLGTTEGFFLFDLDEGGNGTAQAIHRDGVEPLLRLCRLLIERVLYPDRLLALHDHWGDEAEILAATDLPSWERYTELRQGALTWLDSRLRPEGRAEGTAEGTVRAGSGKQAGEGDAIDIGRCWFSVDGGVADLVWAKHRWRLPEGGEAMLDVAFDRRTVAESRRLAAPEGSAFLGLYRAWHALYLAREELRLADGTVWGAPRLAWFPGREAGTAKVATEGLAAEVLPLYHAMAEAFAAHGWPAVEVLARTLRERSGIVAEGEEGRRGLLQYLSHFVQGIPYSMPGAVVGGLRPPVSTLLYRLGDCDSKSLLLALLARHCGLAAGLFVSFSDRHALAAVAVPELGEAAGRGEDGPMPLRLAEWSERAGLARPPRLWAEMPVSAEAGAPSHLYVPVESTVYSRVGEARPGHPGTWIFLPLTAIAHGIPDDLADSVPASDTAESEERE